MADDKQGSLLDVQLGSEGYGIIATPLSDTTNDVSNTGSSNEGFYSSGDGTLREGGKMSTARQRIGGRTANFLESKGFGWLLDSEEDEDQDKPLL